MSDRFIAGRHRNTGALMHAIVDKIEYRKYPNNRFGSAPMPIIDNVRTLCEPLPDYIPAKKYDYSNTLVRKHRVHLMLSDDNDEYEPHYTTYAGVDFETLTERDTCEKCALVIEKIREYEFSVEATNALTSNNINPDTWDMYADWPEEWFEALA